MKRPASSPSDEAPGYRVQAPRAGDAIGNALRGAYEQDLGLPEDMAAMLRQLNGATTRQYG